ncbi:serine-rich protein, putative [Cordyceps militaris]|uniref:Serine-rich protein, putative n=1 Tax=Cordyceps militaris TaxID=73501 RepID=A0A2H4S8L0_CORMI|nr:serine-rich protein, putative [Cordyceps militaris]
MTTTRLPLQDRSNLQNNLQIRVVPYSPPRLSSDFSIAPHPDKDTCKPSYASSPANVEVYQSDTPQTQRLSPCSSPVVSSPASPLGSYSRPNDHGTDRRRAATPRRPSTSSSNRRLKHVVNVHSDKTFSLRPQVERESSSVYSSSFLNSTLTNSTYGRNSSVTLSHGRRSSVMALRQPESAPTSPDEKTPPKPSADNSASTSSPWNYEFVGGLRKVYRHTPAPDEAASSPIATPSKAHLPPSIINRAARQSSMLIPRKPLPSSYLESPAASDTPNVRILRQPLPTASLYGQPSLEFTNFSPSSDENYRIIGDSGSSDYSLGSQSRPRTEDSEPNYVKLDGAASPSVAATPAPRLKSEFSQESLIVAPLNPARKLFTDKPISVKLPQGGSSPRFIATWSAMMNHDAARALFGSRIYPPRSRNTRAPSQTRSPLSTPKAHQSQFQSQPPLSTVFSESEGENGRRPGSLSTFAAELNPSADDLQPGESSLTRQVMPTSEPVDWPQAAFGKGQDKESNSSYHLVGDQDEHGDGLTDLRDLLTHRPSRRGVFPAMMANYASDRNLWSSASARATNWAIPAWARLYYGGDERRFLAHQVSRDSIRSVNTDGQAGSSLQRFSNSVEQFGVFPHPQQEAPIANGKIPVTIQRSYPDLTWARTLKKQTSSLWSPHLRRDNRASTHGIWDPPAGVVSVEGCITARRNVQVVLFMFGFIFPIAWMVAAFVPLPNNRNLNDKDFPSTSHIDLTEDVGASPSQLAKEIALYNRAKWWRDLNRAMAVIGLLIIGAFAVLIALGVKQRWR